MLLVDSHCHLDSLDYQTLHQNVDDALAKAKACDVGYVLAVATTLPGYRSMTELIGERNDVAFSCGVHPLNLEEGYDYAELPGGGGTGGSAGRNRARLLLPERQS